MDPMKIEWVYHNNFDTEERWKKRQARAKSLLGIAIEDSIPVVRLDAVDAILEEAVWAMQYLEGYMKKEVNIKRAQAFLASLTVTDWEKRQKMKRDIPASFGDIQDKQEEHNG